MNHVFTIARCPFKLRPGLVVFSARSYGSICSQLLGKKPPVIQRQLLFQGGFSCRWNHSTVRRLTAAEAGRVFGKRVDARSANALLQALQRQRLEGTLDHGVEADADHAARALRWLRQNYPVDEDAAIVRRIEREEDIQPESHDSVYGRPGLEEIKKYNEEKRRIEDELEAQRREEKAGGLQTTGSRGLSTQTEPSWVKKYADQALLSTMKAPPEMPKSKRLFPSAIFTAATITFCGLFAYFYVPPLKDARLFPDTPPAAATIRGLVAVNFAVFLLWRFPPMWRLMNQYFLMIPATPKAVSLLGNVFSHQHFTHLLANMLVLWFVGAQVHDQVGRGNFLALYVSSGVFASFVSLSRFVLISKLTQSSLGASGAMTGLIACYLSRNANENFTFVLWPWEDRPHFTGKSALALILLVELIGLRRLSSSSIDHVSHLGGYAAGLVWAQVLGQKSRSRV